MLYWAQQNRHQQYSSDSGINSTDRSPSSAQDQWRNAGQKRNFFFESSVMSLGLPETLPRLHLAHQRAQHHQTRSKESCNISFWERFLF